VLDYAPLDFHSMAILGATSHASFNDHPTLASRPFDVQREGFVPAHGCATMILETFDHAVSRGAKIHAELAAVTACADATREANPSREGQARVMKEALRQAGMRFDEIGFVSAHATSTQLGDTSEAEAIRDVFPVRSHLRVNAPKSILGHTCWSAALVEGVAGILQLQEQRLHPSINIDALDPSVDFDVCRGAPVAHRFDAFVNNAFGLGGINSASIFKRVES